ncbi:MAG TPA: FkbM family methyltransferase [Stellaceae bacterium]|jgi:FkbM family methyltransferase|nr:FkbM family methyltransferase [Stellaceae bacterium]
MYEFIEIVDEKRRRFSLALPTERGAYAESIATFARRDNNLHQNANTAVLIMDHLRGRGTLIDVGSSIGLVSLPVAVSGSNVVAVELLPENCFYQHLSIIENRLGNLRLFQAAAGAQRGLVGFAGTEAWGHVAPLGTGPAAPMLRLDDIVQLVNRQTRRFVRRPLLIKVDTEGYELPVLRGATAAIAAYDPVFLVECIVVEGREEPSDLHARAVKEFLEESGYHLYLQHGSRLAPRTAADIQEGHVCDFLATRRRYRPGDRIGRFEIGDLSFDQSLAWIGEMTGFELPPHRLHAVGVIARWIAEGRRDPAMLDLGRRLCRDTDDGVARAATRLLPALR